MPTRLPYYPHSPGLAPHQVSSTNLAVNYLAKLRKAMVTPSSDGSGGADVNVGPSTGGTRTVTTPGRWDMPDYAALIASDPGLAATNARIGGSGENAATTRAAAAQQAVIRAGFAPDLGRFANQYGDITAGTLSAAAANPASQLAGLQTTRNRGSADLAAVLAGRGMLSSGGLAGGEQRLLEGFQGGQATVADQLAQALGGYEGSYADALAELARQREEALAQARLSIAQMYPPTYTDPTTTTVDVPPPPDPYTTPPYVPYTPLPPGPVTPAQIPPSYPGDIYWNPATGGYQSGRPAGGTWGV